ncbi:MAG: hypothetical protein ACLT76_13880 [Clostridium fessum]
MAPIAAPAAIPATIASGMLVLESMQTTMDAIPRMDPCGEIETAHRHDKE